MHCDERCLRAQTTSIFRNDEKKNFRQYNFRITIFHLSIRLTTDKTAHAMDKRLLHNHKILIVLLSLLCVERGSVTHLENGNKKNEKKRNGGKTGYEWDAASADASHLGHISCSSG